MLVLHAHKRRYKGNLLAYVPSMFQFDVPFQIIRPSQRYPTDVTSMFVGIMRFHVLFYVGYALATDLTAIHTNTLRVL